MDDVMAVCVIECRGNSAGERDDFFDGKEFFAIEALTERFAFDVRHDVIEEAVDFARIVQRKDMRMSQPGGCLYLAQKSVGAE